MVAFAATTIGGCYTYAPVAGPAPTGQTVVFELTDQARVDLNGTIGAFPFRVEGRLMSLTDSTYTVAVRNVESVRGDAVAWTGEPVTLRRSGIAVARVKRLNRGRTVLVGVVAVGAVGLLIATRSLLGLGGTTRNGDEVRPPVEPPPSS